MIMNLMTGGKIIYTPIHTWDARGVIIPWTVVQLGRKSIQPPGK